MAVRAAIIFDLDGTLTKPCLDFDAIRKEIGIAEGPVLEAMEKMATSDRQRAGRILVQHECEAAEKATLQDGAESVVRTCRERGFPVAILTRNARATVDLILRKHGLQFDAIRTREDGAIKPSAEPILSICAEVGVPPESSWMVGDYLFDLLAGEAAGARTVLMIGDRDPPSFAHRADHVIRRLSELLAFL